MYTRRHTLRINGPLVYGRQGLGAMSAYVVRLYVDLFEEKRRERKKRSRVVVQTAGIYLFYPPICNLYR